jgi:chaperone required for assembly of F1-ATPase
MIVKRFYKDAGVDARDGAFAILLDGKPVKTPRREMLAVPSQALADAIAREWHVQGKVVALDTMPLTRLAHGAIDGAAHRARIVGEAMNYARSDLLYYRAEMPAALTARQARDWNPLLDWARTELGASLATTKGIKHIEQSADALAALETRLNALDDYTLVATGAAIAILGSAVLGLALAHGRLTPPEAFALSRLDESFQAEKWGADAEAQARADRLLADLEAAGRFIRLASAQA